MKISNFLSKWLLVSLVLLALGVGNAWGTDYELVYTLTPASGSNNAYANACDVSLTNNGQTISWNITGNSQQQPWRIGGKNITNVSRAVYSKNAITGNITKIEIKHGDKVGITVNSMSVIVSTAQNGGGTVISSLTPEYVDNGTVTITVPTGKDWTDRYYKIVYNVTNTSTKDNGYVKFAEAKFYRTAASCSTDPSIGTASLNGTF